MLTVGSILNDRYKLIDFIAPGGMGEVWKATDLILEREIALKVVNGNYIKQNPNAIKILKDEAKAGASLLGHPNIVAITDFGTFEVGNLENYYIVMEYVDGVDLHNWIENYRNSADPITYYNICLLIALEVVRATDYAHRRGILHRDIKPLNVFLSKTGMIKVGDFGLARFIEAVTRTHSVWHLGTSLYLAPEQWKGHKATKETDIYQLGCTLYHLFTGSLPFERNSGAALMYAHLNDTPINPKELNSAISENLSSGILEMMEKEGKDRSTIWEIRDKIAKEVQKVFTADFNKLNKQQLKLVSSIAEFDVEAGDGPIRWDFFDYSEILSYGIQFLFLGVSEYTIQTEEQEEQGVAVSQVAASGEK